MEIRADLEAVKGEFDGAADRLTAIISHIRSAGPDDPLLRVTMLNNVVVALCSTVEESIRNLFDAYLYIMEVSHPRHDHLRKELQRANVDSAIAELTTFKKLNNVGDAHEATIVLRNLSRCLSGEEGYTLFRSRITYNHSNFRTDQITTIAKRVGIPTILSTICDCADFEDWTNAMNTEDRVRIVGIQWNEIFDERDLVVHRLSSANGWNADRIERAVQLTRLLLKRLCECLIIDASETVRQIKVRIAAGNF